MTESTILQKVRHKLVLFPLVVSLPIRAHCGSKAVQLGRHNGKKQTRCGHFMHAVAVFQDSAPLLGSEEGFQIRVQSGGFSTPFSLVVM